MTLRPRPAPARNAAASKPGFSSSTIVAGSFHLQFLHGTLHRDLEPAIGSGTPPAFNLQRNWPGQLSVCNGIRRPWVPETPHSKAKSTILRLTSHFPPYFSTTLHTGR